MLEQNILVDMFPGHTHLQFVVGESFVQLGRSWVGVGPGNQASPGDKDISVLSI